METLGKYFAYNTNPDKARELFVELDYKMKELHREGKYIDINASTIAVNETCEFLRTSKGLTKELQQQNIETLAKLAVGTYFSLPSGTFYDYSSFPTETLRTYFDSIESNIPTSHPEDTYYREVLMNGNMWYYNDYLNVLQKQSPGKDNSRVLSYSTPQGRAMTSKDEAAFINVAFYPIIVTLFIVIGYMIYILVK